MFNQKQIQGQYFTTDTRLLSCLLKFIFNDNGPLLEPSFGRGHIIKYLQDNHKLNRVVYGIELDTCLKPIFTINDNIHIKYCDFLSYETTTKFKTIVGNPPYFKLAKKDNPNKRSILKTTNMYIAFIEKAVELLDYDNGELVFVIPSDFFKISWASQLKEVMLKNGSFTHVFHPNKENLFKEATQDVMVIRYQKGLKQKYVIYNDEEHELTFSQGTIYIQHPSKTNINGIRLNELFDIKVGMVSGASKVFANRHFGNIDVLTSNGIKKEIFLDTLPKEETTLYKYLLSNKEYLINRKINNFNEDNWFKWGCLRNLKFIQKNQGNRCLYAKAITRRKDVFFSGVVDYYDGTVLCLFPKRQEVSDKIHKFVEYLNNESFLKHFEFSGRYKFGQKTLGDFVLPSNVIDML